MPIREYVCEDCGHIWEEITWVKEDDVGEAITAEPGNYCPACGSKNTSRRPSLYAKTPTKWR